jgi:predicted metal-binding membrane protein
VLAGIALLAWASLWWLERSAGSGPAQLHHALPGRFYPGVFLAGWLLMSLAMMLPTSTPLVVLFSRMVSRRAGHAVLVSALLAGYVTAWLGLGVLVLVLAATLESLGLLPDGPHAWIRGSGLLLLAGAFQFSALKYACLDQCRTPLGFLSSHWRGGGATAALRLGWRHGLFCVGCCWALMLLMFAVSVESLAWMLLLALLMAIEKNASWGRRLGRPLGAALLAIGLGLMLHHLAA